MDIRFAQVPRLRVRRRRRAQSASGHSQSFFGKHAVSLQNPWPHLQGAAMTSSIRAVNARNQFSGKVRHIVRGNVVSEVEIHTAWGIVTSVITTRSVDELELKIGSDVVALVKSTEVALGSVRADRPAPFQGTSERAQAASCGEPQLLVTRLKLHRAYRQKLRAPGDRSRSWLLSTRDFDRTPNRVDPGASARRRQPSPPVRSGNGKVVDVASLLLELPQFVGARPPMTYVAPADAAALGLGLNVFISISLKTQSNKSLADFSSSASPSMTR
jgi:molybdopterin-binding protein